MDLGIGGRRAAVAAASRGLGFAAAQALAREGVRVAICGRSESAIQAAAADIGPDAVPIVADVGTAEGAAGFVADAPAALDGIDILVTNAGGPPPGTFATTPIEEYPEAFALNAMSVIAMCHAAVPAMQEKGWGRILAITSIAVRQPIGNLILSNTARAAATGFLKTLALEVAENGITVNSLLPGYHATDRLRDLGESKLEALTEKIPVGFVGDPADFGAVAAFLCSEHARYLTGAAIPLDGGTYKALL